MGINSNAQASDYTPAWRALLPLNGPKCQTAGLRVDERKRWTIAELSVLGAKTSNGCLVKNNFGHSLRHHGNFCGCNAEPEKGAPRRCYNAYDGPTAVGADGGRMPAASHGNDMPDPYRSAHEFWVYDA